MPRPLVLCVLAVSTLTIGYACKHYLHVDASAALAVIMAAVLGGSVLLRQRSAVKRGAAEVQLGVAHGDSLLFSPVWLSSREQLNRVEQLASQITWRERIFGFKQAQDMPHAVMPGWGAVVPLVFRAEGLLELVDGRLRFSASERKVEGFTFHNVDTTVSFDVSFSDISSLNPMKFTSPIAESLTLHWVRVRGATDDADFDLLLAMGGFGVAADVLQQRTLALQDALEREMVLARSAKRGAIAR